MPLVRLLSLHQQLLLLHHLLHPHLLLLFACPLLRLHLLLGGLLNNAHQVFAHRLRMKPGLRVVEGLRVLEKFTYSFVLPSSHLIL